MDIERAIQIAADAHRGQKDKMGQPYILHSLRVMAACSSEAERIVAVLHDVVEDSEWTLDALRQEGLSGDLVAAVDAMTRRAGETYADLVDRAARNPIARAVKIADLRDNLDASRLVDSTDADQQRARKYSEALNMLGLPSD
ncbi:HD domain-containing protein (plasmid) [Paracoccus marcusii]|uniref:HD domain-containing protein n=1 Tax=Paracoccus TaxID=265 RepID=UPI00189139BC|nr:MULTISPECIES: HD domain-containing protein [Paracoccus]MBF5080050.1 HD domain-containing protein [Paracoccus sp. NBH48]QXI65835.1 Bifunctional (p)ppGpp synthase/hydrolase RelA [Paracoccus marcusii]